VGGGGLGGVGVDGVVLRGCEVGVEWCGGRAARPVGLGRGGWCGSWGSSVGGGEVGWG